MTDNPYFLGQTPPLNHSSLRSADDKAAREASSGRITHAQIMEVGEM